MNPRKRKSPKPRNNPIQKCNSNDTADHRVCGVFCESDEPRSGIIRTLATADNLRSAHRVIPVRRGI